MFPLFPSARYVSAGTLWGSRLPLPDTRRSGVGGWVWNSRKAEVDYFLLPVSLYGGCGLKPLDGLDDA